MRRVNRLAYRARLALERAPRRRWRRLLVCGGLVAFALGGTSAVAHRLVTSGWLAARLDAARLAVDAAVRAGGLVVRDVAALGGRRTARADLLQILERHEGKNLLMVDLRGMRERIEALPWVRSATVSRHLPDSLLIEIEERRPTALWWDTGRLRLVDEDGDVVGVSELAPFASMPVLHGADAPRAARDLFAMLAGEPALAGRVTGASLVAGRRWNLFLDGRVEVRLPASDAAAAWRRLAAHQRGTGLLERAVEMIDLRDPERVVVRLPAGARA